MVLFFAFLSKPWPERLVFSGSKPSRSLLLVHRAYCSLSPAFPASSVPKSSETFLYFTIFIFFWFFSSSLKRTERLAFYGSKPSSSLLTVVHGHCSLSPAVLTSSIPKSSETFLYFPTPLSFFQSTRAGIKAFYPEPTIRRNQNF